MKYFARPYPYILAGAAIAAALTLFFLYWSPDPVPINIITHHEDIRATDYRDFMARRKFDHSDPATLFTNGAVTRQTIPFLNHLAEEYRDLPEPEKSKAINEKISSILGPTHHGSVMLKIAQIHAATRREEARHLKRWFSEKDQEKLLANLREMQDLRRARFGRENADILFGTEIKSLEYTLRKHGIITDKKVTGSEKENRLAALRKTMWGHEAATIDSWQTPAQRCEEKIAIFENDFNDIGDNERLKKIRKIRLDFFSPEEVNRIEAVEQRAIIARRRDREYYRRSRPILDDRDLTDAEKSELLMKLQYEIFGTPGNSRRR